MTGAGHTHPPLRAGEKMNRDRYDLPLTTESDRAAAFYRDGVDRMLSAWNGCRRGLRQRHCRGSQLRAGAHRARAHPSDEHGNRRGPGQRGAGPAAGGRGKSARTAARRDHGGDDRRVSRKRRYRRRTASRGISARRPDPVAAARRISVSMPSPAAPITTRRSLRSASVTPANTARIGGFSAISAGRIPKPATPVPAAR